MTEDVPSPIDLTKMSDAKEWEQTAMERPFRIEFFDQFLSELTQINKVNLHILELGSGPGFLAKHLLDAIPSLHLDLLDFSAAMHKLAKARIGTHLSRVQFLEQDFKDPQWALNLGQYDAVITNQAIHELRHKKYAQTLHEQVKPLLNQDGIYLVCDHFYEENTPKNNQLFMNLAENEACLKNAGYSVTEVFIKAGRVLNRAT